MIEEIKTYEVRKQELIEKGKETGFITYEQLALALKGLDLDSDSLDDLYNSLMEANIQVVTDENEGTEEDISADGGIEAILARYSGDVGRLFRKSSRRCDTGKLLFR